MERLVQATFQTGQVCPFTLRSDGLGRVILCSPPAEEEAHAPGPSRSRRRCLAARQLRAGDQAVSVGQHAVSLAALSTANSYLGDQGSVRELVVRRGPEQGSSRRPRRPVRSALSLAPDDRRERSIVQPFGRPAPAAPAGGGGDDVISLLEEEESSDGAHTSASNEASEATNGQLEGAQPRAGGAGADAGAAASGASCCKGVDSATAATGPAGAADGLQLGMMVSTPYGPGVVDELSSDCARVRFTWADGHMARACVSPLKDRVALRYAPGGTRAMVLTGEDEARLQPGYHLNDTLIDWYLRYLRHERWDRQQLRVHACTSLLLARLEEVRREAQTGPARKRRRRESNTTGPAAGDRTRSRTEAADDAAHAQVRGWLRRVDLFSLSVLLLPVCRHNHWSLAMVLNLPLLGERIAATAAEEAAEEGAEGAKEKCPPAKLRRARGGKRGGVGKGRGGGGPSKARAGTYCGGAAGVEKEEKEGKEELDPNEPVPCIVLLDSMGVHRSQTTAAVIRAYLAREWCSRHPYSPGIDASWALDAATLPCMSLDAPRQLNEVDCGVFLLEYAERYVAPLAGVTVRRRDISGRLGRVMHTFEAFDQGTVDAKRLAMRQLVARLARGEAADEAAPAAALGPACASASAACAPAPASVLASVQAPASVPAPAPTPRAPAPVPTPAPAVLRAPAPASARVWASALSPVLASRAAEARSPGQAPGPVPERMDTLAAAHTPGSFHEAVHDEKAPAPAPAPAPADSHGCSPPYGPFRVPSSSGPGKEVAVSAALEAAQAQVAAGRPWSEPHFYPSALPRVTDHAPFAHAPGAPRLSFAGAGERHATEPACAPTAAPPMPVHAHASTRSSAQGTVATRGGAVGAAPAAGPRGTGLQWGSPQAPARGRGRHTSQAASAEAPGGGSSVRWSARATAAGGQRTAAGGRRHGMKAEEEEEGEDDEEEEDEGGGASRLSPFSLGGDGVPAIQLTPGVAPCVEAAFAQLDGAPPGDLHGLQSGAMHRSRAPSFSDVPLPGPTNVAATVPAAVAAAPRPAPTRPAGCGARRRRSGLLVAGFRRGLHRLVRQRHAVGGSSSNALAEMHAWYKGAASEPGSTHWQQRRNAVLPHTHHVDGAAWAGERAAPARREARRPEDLPEQARSEDEDEDAHFLHPEFLSEVDVSGGRWSDAGPHAAPVRTLWGQGPHEAASTLPDGMGRHTAGTAALYTRLGVHPV